MWCAFLGMQGLNAGEVYFFAYTTRKYMKVTQENVLQKWFVFIVLEESNKMTFFHGFKRLKVNRAG